MRWSSNNMNFSQHTSTAPLPAPSRITTLEVRKWLTSSNIWREICRLKGNFFWYPPPFQMNLALSAFRTQWEGDRPSRAAHKNQPYVFTLHCAWQFTQLEFMQKPGKIIREKIPWSAEMEESPHSWSLSTYICSISCTTQTGSTNHMDSVAEDKIQNLLSHEVRRKKKRKWHRQAENLNVFKVLFIT